ncbi:hypothetical protein JOF56_009268 [Kibdelosporangium banguiense]|uniref:Minor tail protein n=1 Tax=Kibdelosporangium banguiense TaxID=1365924 RepID=A0ABS4TXY6_9PSEU|nr:hypothetical protein [Kibdelosporangium banguiense]MBP2328883.1 hypothetical protein [Kibdelosporangium banguiense]
MTTHPTFACGQVLTSDDLNGIISWVTSIRQLAAQRDGWGVLQGLEVSAVTGTVTVGPGHAISPTGDDLIVANAQQLTLEQKAGTYDVNIAYAETESGDHDHPLVSDDVTITVSPAANTTAVVNEAIAGARELKLEPSNKKTLQDWLGHLVDAHPSGGFCFQREWITGTWGPLPGYFVQLLGWWAADMFRTAAEERPSSNELLLAQVIVAENGPPTVDNTVRKMLHATSGGAVPPTDAYGRGLSEATATLTGRGVVVSEWTEWNPATVADVSALFPAPAVGPGTLVQVRHAVPPNGKTPLVVGAQKIAVLP